MASISPLPKTIPLFPLSGALLLPRARLPLNIFEPRYLTMLDDVLKTDHRLIGMLQSFVGPKEGAEETLHHIGCAGRITSFSETEDGRYLITFSGVSRFRVETKLDTFTPYLKADVDWTSFQRDVGRSEVDDTFNRPAFLKVLSQFFELTQLSSDWGSLKEADEELLINSLSMLCPFGTEEKQALLEAPTLKNRRETLVTLMEFALRGGSEEDQMQ